MTTSRTRTTLLAGAALLASASIAGAATAGGSTAASASTSASAPPRVAQAGAGLNQPQHGHSLRPASSGKRWTLFASVASVGDSNIDHEPEARADVGGVAGVGATYSSTLGAGSLAIRYELAAHQYRDSERWNRLSQVGVAEFRRPLGRHLESRTTAEVSLKGSSEDRELSDNYTLRQGLEFDLGRDDSIELAAAWRLKRYADDSGRDAKAPYAELEWEHDLAGDQEVELSYRFQINDARNPDRDYQRSTYGIAYERPLGRARLELEARYRPQTYRRRIEIDDEEDLFARRRDQRWILGVTYSRALFSDLDLVVAYELETRSSNDPDKEFDASLFAVTLRQRW